MRFSNALLVGMSDLCFYQGRAKVAVGSWIKFVFCLSGSPVPLTHISRGETRASLDVAATLLSSLPSPTGWEFEVDCVAYVRNIVLPFVCN